MWTTVTTGMGFSHFVGGSGYGLTFKRSPDAAHLDIPACFRSWQQPTLGSVSMSSSNQATPS